MSGERRSTRALAADAAKTKVPAAVAAKTRAPRPKARPASLHIGIIRPSSALGDDPVDVLGRVFDVAGLAVDAILRVDREARSRRFLDEFVDAGRAVSLLR